MIGVLEREWLRYVELLEREGETAVGASDPAALHATHGDAIEILVASPDLAAEAVGRLGNVRWIQSSWAGVEPLLMIDLPADLVVTRAVDVFGSAMREFVFGHLLSHTLRVHDRVHASAWDHQPPGTVAGSSMGIMGTGSIGAALAETARHFGMCVRGLSRSSRAVAGFDRVFGPEDVFSFAHGLDHLVSTLPNTAETRALVSTSVLEVLGDGATFINVGRGQTTDTDAVVAALDRGRLSLAVLDVLPEEPLPDGDPLWDVPGLVITSHTAAWSEPEAIVELFLDNLRRHRAGTPLRGVVDFTRGY